MKDKYVQDVMTNLVAMLYPNDTVMAAARRLARNGIGGAPVVRAGKVIGIVSRSDLSDVRPGNGELDGAPGKGAPDLGAPGDNRPAHGAPSFNGRSRRGTRRLVSDVMTTKVTKVSPETTVWAAAAILQRGHFKRLPVVDDQDNLVGIVTREDLIRAMAEIH